MTIKSNKELISGIFEMVLVGELAKNVKEPGAFLAIKVCQGFSPYLRRPISICKNEGDEITIVYRVQGSGTKLMSQKKSGEEIDVLGPLGHGFNTELAKGKKALLIGGGIGTPPMYELSRRLHGSAKEVTHILGFAKEDQIFYKDKFEALGRVIITTEDGSAGIKGYVTDALKEAGDYDIVYSCGPTPMLKALCNAIKDKELYISIEERMACAIGACYGCVCHTENGGYKRVCKDGPVFKAGEVVL